MTATTNVTKWFEGHKDAARLIAEESAKDEMDALHTQIASVENETEELATLLRSDGKKMMEIMRECEPLQTRQKDLEDQLEGVAPSMEDVNAYALQAVLQDLVGYFVHEAPYHIHVVIPGKPVDSSGFGDVLSEIIDAPRTKTTGKSFLRITGSEINYVGSFRECVTQLYDANNSCKLRYATRQLAAEEARINEKSGNEILVQKMGARMKISTMLSDLYDPRMTPLPWGLSNVVEVGRTKPDGTDSVEMTARLVMADDVPEGIRNTSPGAVAFTHIQQNDKNDSSVWRPIGTGGTVAEHWDDDQKSVYLNGGHVFEDYRNGVESAESETKAEPEAAVAD